MDGLNAKRPDRRDLFSIRVQRDGEKSSPPKLPVLRPLISEASTYKAAAETAWKNDDYGSEHRKRGRAIPEPALLHRSGEPKAVQNLKPEYSCLDINKKCGLADGIYGPERNIVEGSST